MARNTQEKTNTYLSEFTRAYTECILWTLEDSDKEEILDFRISNSARKRIDHDCAAFCKRYAKTLKTLEEKGYDATCAGRDFWLSRNEYDLTFTDHVSGWNGQMLNYLCGNSHNSIFRPVRIELNERKELVFNN